MLAVVYNGRRIFEEMTVDAELSQLEDVYSFIKQQLRSCGFDSDSVAQFSIIADEICANIVRYAYPGGGGKLTVGYSFDPASNEAALTFTDEGIPFNPLKAPDPDLESPEEREEGGLGLFLVRKFSDRLQYEYSNGKNILTITKRREP
jgi:anti-sigma regulatory factor (Ser/Thr protein kinase)